MKMHISVIIPVYNRAEKAEKAIESALGQSHPPSEVIVVDDGSTDDLGRRVKRLNDRRLRYVRQENRGVSAARNLGIKNSSSEWLAFLDSDDYWLPDKLKTQVEYHGRRPDSLISQTDELWIRNGIRVNPKEYHLKVDGDVFLKSLERCMISPSATMIKKTLLEDIGCFDETLPTCEDYDLWLRIACRYPVGLVKEKLVVKTGGHGDQLSKRYWGMDRYRLIALEKLLDEDSLTAAQRSAVLIMAIAKAEILLNGSIKRGKAEDVEVYKEKLDLFKKLTGKAGHPEPEIK